MLIQNQYLHRFAAFSMAIFGLCVFFRGVNQGEYRVLEDGSLMDSVERNLVCFKNSRTIFTLRAGFDIYRSICYGVSSFFLLLDLLLNSGYLTLPALVLAGGEIVSDFSDFCLAIVLIALNIGGYQAAAYGLTYLTLLMVEVAIWLGTCKFHEYCRTYKIESKMLRKKQEDLNQEQMKDPTTSHNLSVRMKATEVKPKKDELKKTEEIRQKIKDRNSKSRKKERGTKWIAVKNNGKKKSNGKSTETDMAGSSFVPTEFFLLDDIELCS